MLPKQILQVRQADGTYLDAQCNAMTCDDVADYARFRAEVTVRCAQ